METILSFLLVVIFSGWVLHLKTEIDTLQKLVGHAFPTSPHKSAQGGVESFFAGSSQDKPVKANPAPKATLATGSKTTRKGGVPTWTIS